MGFVTRLSQIIGALLVTAALAGVAGCQSANPLDALDLSSRKSNPPVQAAGDDAPVKESELRAFCPVVRLREGTSYFSTYAGKKNDDPTKLIYQASISDVTRKCNYNNGTIHMEVAVAGRIVPGPAGKAGTLSMPIRVVVLGTDGKPTYSELFKHDVAVTDTIGATQFLFIDPDVAIPQADAQSVAVFVGYDKGR